MTNPQFKAELQSRLNAVNAASSLHDLIKLRSAVRGLQLNETQLDTELSTRLAAVSPATALDELFKFALALPVYSNPTVIGEVKVFNSDLDVLTDTYGNIWLRAGVITYDTAAYPDAQKLPLVNADPSVVTPITHASLSGVTQKRIASSGSVVVAINAAGNSLTRFTNFTSAGTTIPGTGVLSGATWFSITWDARQGLFVMLGMSSLKIVTSPDGENWTVASLPANAPAPSSVNSAIIFAAAERLHLVILNKHYTTTALVSWVAQTDIASPNGTTETLANRDLRGMVQAPGGQLLLWGAFWPTAAGAFRPFVAVGDSVTLGCNFNINDIYVHSSNSITCATYLNNTDFELVVTAASNTDTRLAVVQRSGAGTFSLSIVESSFMPGDAPTAATNYMGLTIRCGASVTALNHRRTKALPYTVTTTSFLSGSSKILNVYAGSALVRIGTTFYMVGGGSLVSAFDFKWMIGMPLQAPLDASTISSVGSYAANFVRIK